MPTEPGLGANGHAQHEQPAIPTFLTPDVGHGATLTFRLTVTCPDGSNGSNDGTVSVINVNRPPVAYVSAAPPIAYEGDAVVLHSYALQATRPQTTPMVTRSFIRGPGPRVPW